jgi:hypothetical protein
MEHSRRVYPACVLQFYRAFTPRDSSFGGHSPRVQHRDVSQPMFVVENNRDVYRNDGLSFSGPPEVRYMATPYYGMPRCYGQDTSRFSVTSSRVCTEQNTTGLYGKYLQRSLPEEPQDRVIQEGSIRPRLRTLSTGVVDLNRLLIHDEPNQKRKIDSFSWGNGRCFTAARR